MKFLRKLPNKPSRASYHSKSKPSPRIAFFLRTLGGGGAERVVLNLSRSFIEKGLSVDLVLSSGGGPHLWLVPDGVRVIDLHAPRVSASLPALIRYLQREEPDFLLPALHYTSEVALLAKRLARVSTQIVVTEHNTLTRELTQEVSIARRLIPFFVRHLYPWADDIIAVSKGAAIDLAQVTGLPANRIRVIYNPVVTLQMREMAKEPLNHPWFAEGEPPVILGVGKLEAQKDFPNLIRAFAKVRQIRPARLVILGWGPDRPQLENLIQELGLQEAVDLHGHVKNPFNFMARADVFALSSAWEGLPTVLIEAMALGTPVVSTDCESGPSEILMEGKYGYLAPVGDSEVLADVILQVLSGKAKSIDAGWLEQFGLEAATQKYLNILGIANLVQLPVSWGG